MRKGPMKNVRTVEGARRHGSDQGGFTLLESLIAMTVLAIGLLGLAAMQTIALSFNVNAKELGRATNLAAGMMERIHYNRINAAAYNGINTSLVPGLACPNAPAGTEPTARGDCVQWRTDLATLKSELDNPQGTVAVVSPFGPAALNQSQVAVTVAWTTKRGDKKVSRPASILLRSVMTPL